MSYNFYSCDLDQNFLLPPSTRDWLPAGDFVWFLLDVVVKFDLKPFRHKYREDGRGHPASCNDLERRVFETLLNPVL